MPPLEEGAYLLEEEPSRVRHARGGPPLPLVGEEGEALAGPSGDPVLARVWERLGEGVFAPGVEAEEERALAIAASRRKHFGGLSSSWIVPKSAAFLAARLKAWAQGDPVRLSPSAALVALALARRGVPAEVDGDDSGCAALVRALASEEGLPLSCAPDGREEAAPLVIVDLFFAQKDPALVLGEAALRVAKGGRLVALAPPALRHAVEKAQGSAGLSLEEVLFESLAVAHATFLKSPLPWDVWVFSLDEEPKEEAPLGGLPVFHTLDVGGFVRGTPSAAVLDGALERLAKGGVGIATRARVDEGAPRRMVALDEGGYLALVADAAAGRISVGAASRDPALSLRVAVALRAEGDLAPLLEEEG